MKEYSSVKKARKVAICLSLAAFMMLSTGFAPTNVHDVTIDVDGKTIETRTTHTTPDIILARAGVKLDSKDEYNLTKQDGQTVITVHRAVPVTIESEGTKKTVLTSRPTVGDLLLEEGYDLDEIEAAPGFDARITQNLDVKLTPSQKRKQELAAQSRADAPGFGGFADFGAPGSGEYSGVLTMEATAYTGWDPGCTGITAMGLAATHGVVAVDPDVIPLGTRLYIPGYGPAIAGDTGGAIIGNRIDLCMDSYDEAMAFGRRYVTVYIMK